MRAVLILVALALPGCSSVMVCCSEGANVKTDPEVKVDRRGGPMTEEIFQDAVQPGGVLQNAK